MTLTELRYIAVLAEERHFGRAAERCNVSQPTLSIAVKKLEDELDAVLFERGKQSVAPTPLGRRIVAMAEQLLERAAAIKDAAAADKDQLEGPLALGAPPTIGPYLLPQFIPLLRETAPRLSLYIDEGSQAFLTQKLRRGELDALLVSAPLSEPDLVVQPLFDEPLVVLLPADHRLAAEKSIDAAQLDPAELLLLGEEEAFREQVLEALPHLRAQRTGAATARSFIRGSTLETLRNMVASRLGVTILPQSAADVSLYAPNVLVTRPLSNPASKRTISLAWRVSYPRHKAIDVLRRAIQAGSPAFWNYNTTREQDTAGILVANRDW